MKGFLINIFKLTSLTILVLGSSLFFVPDVISKYNLLAALPDKHKLLNSIKAQKMILLGGSNVSFGINSKVLENKFQKPTVNMGIHAGIGLRYMINDIKLYLKKGDLIILIPEYEHFYTDNFYGDVELASIIFDIEPQSKNLLNRKQWIHLLKYLPTFSAKKIKNFIPTLIRDKNVDIDIYHRKSFNEYGDAYLHWTLPNQNYIHAPLLKGDEKVNEEVISFLKEFKLFVNQKGARLLIFPPVIDNTSFNNKKTIITKIAKELKNNDIAFECEPISFCYNDSLFFNSYYHLNKFGVDKRTLQLLKDLDRLKSE
jgi:hypothetical protein